VKKEIREEGRGLREEGRGKRNKGRGKRENFFRGLHSDFVVVRP